MTPCSQEEVVTQGREKSEIHPWKAREENNSEPEEF